MVAWADPVDTSRPIAEGRRGPRRRDQVTLQWGASDLIALRKVGLMAGCIRRR